MPRLCLIATLCLFLLGGCSSGDCLPVPEADDTPPTVQMTVFFTDWATGRRDSIVLVTPCEEVPPLEAAVDNAVTVVYAGADGEGMKRLRLGLSLYHTVGVGVQTESFNPAPVTTRCPKKMLVGKQTIAGGQGHRNITLRASGENWSGLHTATPTLVVRQRPRKRL